MSGDDENLPSLWSGYIRPAGKAADSAYVTSDDDDDMMLPTAAARHREWYEIETPPEKLKVYAEIDRIMSTKVVAGDSMAATARNQAIQELKSKGCYDTATSYRDDVNDGGIEPGWAQRMLPDYVPEPATGFSRTAKRQRVSLKERQSGARLVQIIHDIGRTKDRSLTGRLLREAKRLVGHGNFETWVADKLSMSPRTAREIMAEKKVIFPAPHS